MKSKAMTSAVVLAAAAVGGVAASSDSVLASPTNPVYGTYTYDPTYAFAEFQSGTGQIRSYFACAVAGHGATFYGQWANRTYVSNTSQACTHSSIQVDYYQTR